MPDAAERKKLGDLPEWDLSDLYPGPDSPKLAADLDRAEAAAKDFRARYQDQLPAFRVTGWPRPSPPTRRFRSPSAGS